MPTPREDSSEALDIEGERAIALLRAGDVECLERVMRHYASSLCDLAFGYLRSRDAAEEVVQELFAQLWINRHSFQPSHGLRAYLFASVRNRSLNALRHESATDKVVGALSRDGARLAPAADEDVMAADLTAAVAGVVAEMPPRCREVFTLVRSRQLSYAEVAAILGIAPKTIEVHMTRALAILRARLGAWM